MLKTTVISIVVVNDEAYDIFDIEDEKTALNLFNVETLYKIEVILKHRDLEILSCWYTPNKFFYELH